MIYTEKNMQPLFTFFESCRGVEQSEKHHPEGDVFIHSLQVMTKAFRETNDTDLILAAMLHDVGKIANSKGHEKIGVHWLRPYLSVKSLFLIEHHMRIWYYMFGEMKRLMKCKFISQHPWLPELIQLGRFDYIGRKKGYIPKYCKETIIEKLNKAAEKRFNK